MISAYLQQHCGGGQAGSLTRLDRHKRGGPVPDPSTRGSGWVKAPVQTANGRSFMALVNVPEHLLLDDARRDLLQQSFCRARCQPSAGAELYCRYADASGPGSDTFLGFY